MFLGDLVDRGPDSPAVLELVMRLVSHGRAQCILGNHEMNLLRGELKDGNEWFMTPETKSKYESKAVSDQQIADFTKFLDKLPLALEREDLRVVHASWNNESVNRLKQLNGRFSTINAYMRFEGVLDPNFSPESMTPIELEQALRDRDNTPPFMPDLAKYDTDYQMRNPVRVLTSGEEAPAKEPFWAGGKWRMVSRQKWWENYNDETTVIMGHYWRRLGDLPSEILGKDGPDLFEGIEPHKWMGEKNNVYCVDFSVGNKHKARAQKEYRHMLKR